MSDENTTTPSSEENKPSTKSSCFGCLLLIIVAFMIGSCLFGGDDDDKSSAPATSPSNSSTQKAMPSNSTENQNIGLTAEQFIERFNASSRSVNSPLIIGTPEISKGDVYDAFQYGFSDHLALVGTINKKDNSLREVNIIAQPSSNPSENMNIVLSFGTIIMTVSPELTPDGRNNIMRELGLLNANADLSKLNKSTTSGKIKYHVRFLETMGFMFSASNVND